MTDFQMQDESQKFGYQMEDKGGDQLDFKTSEPQPVILDQRFSAEVGSPVINSPVQFDHSRQSPQVMDQIPVTNEERSLELQSQSYHEMNPTTYHVEDTNSPIQSRSPGVIRRVMDVTDQNNQCYTNSSFPPSYTPWTI